MAETDVLEHVDVDVNLDEQVPCMWGKHNERANVSCENEATWVLEALPCKHQTTLCDEHIKSVEQQVALAARGGTLMCAMLGMNKLHDAEDMNLRPL